MTNTTPEAEAPQSGQEASERTLAFFPRPTKPGPYVARSASDKTTDWPNWYVSGPDGRTNYCTDLGGRRGPMPMFCPREVAELVAAHWNATA